MLKEESKLFRKLPKSFRNPHEYNAEYILITGGRYKYRGRTEKEVSNIYFAKYPVTNKLYRRFIRYLKGKERRLMRILPKDEFDKRMTEFASGLKDFGKYLGDGPVSWTKLRSTYDTATRFNGKNQPVVSVTWFDVRAYCYWLSLLEAASGNLSYDKAADLYRLPSEIEWEWAASGGKRKYPWATDKGPPSDELANYNFYVRTTTPVGRYPYGATPEGLMDMAGNVYEWMDNWYDKDNDTRSLRGGYWDSGEYGLRCSYRSQDPPDRISTFNGFRVVRSQS